VRRVPAARSLTWEQLTRAARKQIDLLSRNLRRLRAQAGLTQEPLAEKADLTTRYLQQLEAAQFGASLAVLIRRRRALACRWDSLLEEIE
jgi:transcriptional regulator with XRE-family HTH domain